MRERLTVEVCCGSAEDAARAYAAGADRVELNFALDAGGLTPSTGMLKTALAHAPLPIICMVRPRAGGFCYGELEFASMLDDAKRLMDAGAAGLAFGCLLPEGGIDGDRCVRLMAVAGGGEMVFHRAFDGMAGEPEAAVDTLIGLGFRRVLTSGRAPSAPEGADVIRRCVEHAGDRLEILAGGGVRPHNAEALLAATGVRQLHFTCHTAYEDRSTAGARVRFDAPGAPAFAVPVVDGEALAGFIRQLRGGPEAPVS